MTHQTRQQAMTHFLESFFGKNYRVESLAGDASFRRYHRIFDDQGNRYLLMDAPPPKERVDIFLQVGEVLAEVVNVPNVFCQDVAMGFLLLQDFGDVELAQMITDSQFGHKDEIYQQALQTLKNLQQLDIHKPNVKAIGSYDQDKLGEEMDLFEQWLLPYLGVTIDKTLWQTLKKTVISQVLTQVLVVVHRDYHSRNLMQDRQGGTLGVIDFQDALIGAYSYDLVSLLRDAYIEADEPWVNRQIAIFYQLANIERFDKSLQDFVYDVNVMGVQRHLKVLGIFVRLYQRDGKVRYLANMPKVMSDLVVELDYLATHGSEPIYGQFLAYLQQILPIFWEKFGK